MVFYGLLFYIALEYFRPEVYIPILKVYAFIPVALFIAIFFFNSHISNSQIFKLKNTHLLIFYFILIIISILTADVTLYAFEFFVTIFGYFLLYFMLIKTISGIDKLKKLFWLLIIIHIFLLCLNPDVILHPATRSYLKHPFFLGDGNEFAWSVCIILPFSFYLYQEAKSKFDKSRLIISIVIFIIAIVGTGSRGAALALGSSAFYLWIKSKNKVKSTLAILIVAIGIFIFAPAIYFERLESIKDYEQDGSAQGRIMAWNSAIRMAIDHPFIGIGADHFSVKFGTDYRPPGVGRTDIPWLNAHSIYFKTLGEFGFPGLIFLISILYLNFRNNERLISQMKGLDKRKDITYRRLFISLNASLISYSVGGMFLSGIKYPHLFMVTGIINTARLLYQISSDNSIIK